MFRNLFLIVITALVFCGVPSTAQSGTPLPSSCNSKSAYADANSFVHVLGDTADSDENTDTGSDHEDIYNGLTFRSAAFTLHCAISRPNGNGDSYMSIYAGVASTPTPVYGEIRAAVEHRPEASANYTGGTVRVFQGVYAEAWGDFTIEENATYPMEGLDANSAIASGYFYFMTEMFISDGFFHDQQVEMHAEFQDSYVDVYNLDAIGSVWASEGMVHQVGEDPIEVDDVHYYYTPFFYAVSESTQVGGTLFVRSDMLAFSDWGVNSTYTSGGEFSHLLAMVGYTVEVP